MKDLSCTYDSYNSTWEDALFFAGSWSGGGICGLSDDLPYDDWRVPNVHELHSIMDISQRSPALPVGHPFINIPTEYESNIWTSTTHMDNNNGAYIVRLTDGHVGWDIKDSTNHVIFVRGGN